MARIIIIIDDDAVLREILARILTENGHSVMITANGFEGVKAFRAEPADIILTDIMMPYGGLPTIRVLRAEFPNLKIIALSDGGQPRLDIAAGLGANRTFAKPFSSQELIEAVDEMLGATPAP
jgi:DNA-binding response OmpR family regulator